MLRTGRLIAMIGFTPLLAPTPVAAAKAGPPLRVGELIQNGRDQQVKVLECRTVSYGRECLTVLWEEGRAQSSRAWWDEEMLIKGDQRVRDALAMPPRASAFANAATAPAMGGAPAAGRASTAPRRPAAAAASIPDGTYRCQTWMGSSYVSLGTVRSVGGSLDTNLLKKVGATFTGATATADGVTISYTTARGYRESMDCKRG